VLIGQTAQVGNSTPW